MQELIILNHRNRVRINISSAVLKKTIQTVFTRLKKRDFEINLIFTNNREIIRLNRRFRNTNRTTDVIAFGYDTNPVSGDIFISVEKAMTNAGRYEVTFKEEIMRLAVHGVLHLTGYSDYTENCRRRMWNIQEKVLKDLKEIGR